MPRTVFRVPLTVAAVAALVAAALLVDQPAGRTVKAVASSLQLDAEEAEQPRPTSFAIAGGKTDPTGQEGSGGAAVAHHAGAKPINDSQVTRDAPDARLYRTGHRAWEPNLGVTKSGAVFFDGFNDAGDPAVIRSTDEGATWKVAFDEHGFTADPYLFVDPDTSRVFEDDLIPPCHLISYSDDEGETWTTPPLAGCGYNEDHQTLFAGPAPKGDMQPQGYPNVVYLCSISYGISIVSGGSACSKSLDGGTTYVPTGEPAFYDDPGKSGDYGVPGLCNGANAHGFVGPDGTVYLPRGWCGQPFVAISHNEGLTWDRVQVADNGMPCCGVLNGLPSTIFSHEAGVVADTKGNVYYSWVAADRLPYLTVSRDGGATWGKPMMIGPPGLREALLPGMALGATGKIAVFYMGSTNSPWNGKEAKGSYDNEKWNAYITMTTDALDKDPVFYSASLNNPAETMHVGSCGPDPVRCGWGDFLDIVISPDGEPWAVAVDLCPKGDECSGGGEAVIGRLVGGPSLR